MTDDLLDYIDCKEVREVVQGSLNRGIVPTVQFHHCQSQLPQDAQRKDRNRTRDKYRIHPAHCQRGDLLQCHIADITLSALSTG
jgi:hypothetical protein